VKQNKPTRRAQQLLEEATREEVEEIRKERQRRQAFQREELIEIKGILFEIKSFDIKSGSLHLQQVRERHKIAPRRIEFDFDKIKPAPVSSEKTGGTE